MTRRDFEAIAAVLRAERPAAADVNPFDRDPWGSGTYDEWSTVVLAFGRMLHDASGLDVNGNRRFDADRFYAACGFGGPPPGLRVTIITADGTVPATLTDDDLIVPDRPFPCRRAGADALWCAVHLADFASGAATCEAMRPAVV